MSVVKQQKGILVDVSREAVIYHDNWNNVDAEIRHSLYHFEVRG